MNEKLDYYRKDKSLGYEIIIQVKILTLTPNNISVWKQQMQLI
jgi:hypothetical protein